MRIFKKKSVKLSGATVDKNFGIAHLINNDEAVIAFIESEFDLATDYDVYEIKNKIQKAKLINNVCFIKLCSYPVEYLLTKLLLPKSWAAELKDLRKLYKEYRKGKMSVSDFNTKYNDISEKYLKEKLGA